MTGSPFQSQIAHPPPRLLWAGLTLGFIVAMAGLVERSAVPGADVVATVNGKSLKRDDYNNHLQALSESQKKIPDEAKKRHVLQRMIEEELLIQRATETGLISRNKTVRGNITRAMIDSIIAEAKAEPVDNSLLLDFFNGNPQRFARTVRMRLVVFLLDAQTAGEAAQQVQKIQGQWQNGVSPAELKKTYGATDGQPLLPDALLPPKKISDYIGPSLTKAARDMSPGDLLAPVSVEEKNGPSRYYAIFCLDTLRKPPPYFSDIKEQVEFEYRRTRSDRVLREYLEWLTDRADINMSEDL